MSITAAPQAPAKRRPRREYWHRKFIWAATVQLDGSERYRVRFETVLRRWSASRRCWQYRVASPANVGALLGTDKRRGQ